MSTGTEKVLSVITVGFIVACVVLIAYPQDEQDSVTHHSTATTGLESTPTELALSTDPNRCANVDDWNFFHAKVTQNNLGGKGPDPSGPQEIRFSGVSDEVDLVLTTDAPYTPNPKVKAQRLSPQYGKDLDGAGNNGISGKFGVVNVKGNTEVKMTFTLMEGGTNIPADIAPDQTIFFSVYDLDSDGGTTAEFVKFTTPVDSYSVTKGSSVKLSGTKNNLVATATRKGNEADNPSDPLKMTAQQKDSAVWITYKGRNTWGMTFGEKGNAKGKGGRNLLFAGRAEGDCPPGPVPFPPGACDVNTKGIEGKIQGGGRVCCPDKCGGPAFGGPAKWADAPNACGGPGCDKGADGKRDDFRYQNCCVGKPVTGGTSKSTISAPYGIVSQGRFCSRQGAAGELGTDSPPCINKLTMV
jgi:hypothetical protein